MTEEKTLQVNEKAGIQFSLSFLIQILGTVVLAVWGYSQLDARISNLSNQTSTHKEKIRSIEGDIRDNQDKPISSDHVQNTTLFAHERELQELKARLSQLETRLYDSKRPKP
jgi:chromosome segregation ATPase